MRNLITDIDGILVGQSQIISDGNLSGVTLILPEQSCNASYVQRGGAPASRDLHLLEPEKLVTDINAICLSGGSAYGLAAADGLTKIFHAQQKGFATGSHPVPIIPSASLFDLRLNQNLPDYHLLAQQAFDNTSKDVALGNVGAGAGALSGILKGGIGSASASLPNQPDIKIGALVALNSFGSAIYNKNGNFYGEAFLQNDDTDQTYTPSSNGRTHTGDALQFCKAGFKHENTSPQENIRHGNNTSLVVLATNLTLDKAQLKSLANAGSDGLARAIHPCHTLYDGDICFALSTKTTPPANGDISLLLVQLADIVAQTVTRAVIRAILHAESIPSCPNYHDFIAQT